MSEWFRRCRLHEAARSTPTCEPAWLSVETSFPPPLDTSLEILIFNLMVEYKEQGLDQTYAALADPTRRAILTRLLQQEGRVTELAEPFAMSLNAVSKHLQVLERAGLIRREVRGREHYLSADPEPLQHAADWLNIYRQFWEQRLGRLETFLRRKKASKKTRRKA
jgi:DNA-binding transcriptional ArsR family regulator